MTKEQRNLIQHWLTLVRWYSCPFATMVATEAAMEKAGITQVMINEVCRVNDEDRQ